MRVCTLVLLGSTALLTPPALALEPGLKAIGADPASLAKVGIAKIDGTGVKIGQIESGNPLSTHVALNGHVTIDNDPARAGATTDHATSVAGVIVSQGAAGANATEKGIAPGAQIFSFARGSAPAGNSRSGELIDGAQRLIRDGVTIVNESNSQPLTNAADPTSANGDGRGRETLALDYFADTNNLTWVQTPGNDGGPGGPIGARTLHAPADCYDCIVVGATGPSPGFDQVAAFSPEGRTIDLRNKPDLVAPGSDINMPVTPSPTFAPNSGTSFAAPAVAGAAALLTQFAKSDPGHARNGTDHRVLKAVLLNSASKDGGEKPGEIRVTEKDGKTLWSPTTPGLDSLDDQMGAGQLNVRAAFAQFKPAEATSMSPGPGSSIDFSVDPISWDFNRVYGGNYDQYDLNQKLAAGSKLTATIDWDRIVGRAACAAPCAPLADDTFTAAALPELDLDLYENGKLQRAFDALGRASFSDSKVDNVQQIYFTLPDTASYSLRVTDQGASDALFGFAVWSDVPEPATILVLGIAVAGLAGLRRAGPKALT